MRSWSIPAGRLFGVEVRIHLTFLFLLLFVWMTEAPQAGGVGRGLALVGLIFASVLAHEMGHLLVAQRIGVPVRVCLLLPIGGLSFSEETSLNRSASLRREIPVALAGPVVSLGIAMLATMLALALAPEVVIWKRPYLHSGELVRSLVWVNLYLAVLNLLPAYPLDGGRALRALLAQRMEILPATRVAVTVGQVFAMLFMLAGGVWNYWLTMVGLFLFFAAQIEERTMVFQSVLETVRLEDVMLTDFSTLSPADTLEDALTKAVHTLQDDFPVVRGSDMVGVVSRQKIMEALRAEGNAYVQSIMSRAFEIAGRDDSLALAFRKLSARGLTLLPVVDQERLVGIITLQNLMHSIGLLAESRMLQRDQG